MTPLSSVRLALRRGVAALFVFSLDTDLKSAKACQRNHIQNDLKIFALSCPQVISVMSRERRGEERRREGKGGEPHEAGHFPIRPAEDNSITR